MWASWEKHVFRKTCTAQTMSSFDPDNIFIVGSRSTKFKSRNVHNKAGFILSAATSKQVKKKCPSISVLHLSQMAWKRQLLFLFIQSVLRLNLDKQFCKWTSLNVVTLRWTAQHFPAIFNETQCCSVAAAISSLLTPLFSVCFEVQLQCECVFPNAVRLWVYPTQVIPQT